MTTLFFILVSDFDEFLAVFFEWGILIGSIVYIIYEATTGKRKREEEARRKTQEQERIRQTLMKAQEEERKRRHEEQMRNDPLYRWRVEEEQRHAALQRKNELKAKFHQITLGGYNAAYRYDYYPKNRYPFVDADKESQRQSVWRFKDGSYSIGVSIASDFLEGNFTEEQMRNMVFCVIPASTQYKNETRYKTMCSKIAEKFPIRNGFDCITITEDRENSREQKSSNTIANLTFSGSVYGKDVILFDDITTRGTSFIQAANALKAKGARSVYGLFIGRTVSSY